MATIRTLQRSFSGGEISPEMYGRIDDTKYQSGVATMRNFIARPTGPAENRAGLAFVREVRDSTKKVRLIPFTYSTVQTMVLEFGSKYIRFHTQGSTLISGGSPYEVITPYEEEDLFDLHYVQSADVLTICHPNYAPRELRRLGATNWTLTTVSFQPAMATPTSPSITASPGYTVKISSWNSAGDGMVVTTAPHNLIAGDKIYIKGASAKGVPDGFYGVGNVPTRGEAGTTTDADKKQLPDPYRLYVNSYTGNVVKPSSDITSDTEGAVLLNGVRQYNIDNYYKVTAVGTGGLDESTPSTAVHVVNNLFVTGSYNTISWTAVSGATRYNVYKRQYGIYGYIGQSETTSFVDDNISPDLGISPPIYDTVFGASGDYPSAVSYYEQRRCFAGTTNDPQKLWMTRSNTESDMSYTIPVKDTNRIAFRVAAREANTIRHIVPLSQLILLTSAAEWRVTSVNSDALTPSTISVRPQSYIGASNVQPQIINNSLVYCAARGGHVRELGYSWQSNGYITGDLSLRSAHLFDGYEVVDMAYAKSPDPLIWFVSTSGKLLGLTYVPDQQIGSWHQHDTDGVFESCAVVAEGATDVLYVVVRRDINGVSKRYVERLKPRVFEDRIDAFFVDSGKTYSGDPTKYISGLSHLEGKVVSVLADGAVHSQCIVMGGAITLERAASTVHVGLPYVCDLVTLPMAAQIDGAFGQGRFKNVNKAWLRVYRSSSILVGPEVDRLVEVKVRTTEPYGSPPFLESDEFPVLLTPSWAESGKVVVRQQEPLPLTVVNLTLEVALGG